MMHGDDYRDGDDSNEGSNDDHENNDDDGDNDDFDDDIILPYVSSGNTAFAISICPISTRV